MKYVAVLFSLLMFAQCWAHEFVLEGEAGKPLVAVKVKPQWSVVAARDAFELNSPNDRTRIHCLELRSSTSLEEGRVFLETLRDTLFQSYETTSDEVTDLGGQSALLLRGRGISRGFDTSIEALIFQTSEGHICLVMMQQDVGYEGALELKSLVRVP